MGRVMGIYISAAIVLLIALLFSCSCTLSIEKLSDGDRTPTSSSRKALTTLITACQDITMLFSSPLRFAVTVGTVIASSVFAQESSSNFTLGARELEPLDPPMTTADNLGTHGVGVRRESYSFDNRLLNATWWYPAITTNDSVPFINAGGIVGQAYIDVSIDTADGPYPLIIFSPGLAANDDTYYFYCANLASSGYVVVSINHLDSKEAAVGANPVALVSAIINMLLNNSSWTVWLLYSNWFRSTHFGFTYRPQEQQFMIDKAVESATDPTSFFSGSIDTNNIGMSGHSLGGFWTLIKGGGMSIDCSEALDASDLNTNNILLTHVSICAWSEAQNLSNPQAVEDSRIKAVISLAPPLFFQTEAEISHAASSINKPMMIITGNDPKQESTLAPQEQVYTAAKGSKYLVEVDKTAHLLVSEAYQFNPEPGRMVSEDDKANFVDKATVYETYSAAFFDVYLKNKTERKAVLHEKSSEFVAKLEFND